MYRKSKRSRTLVGKNGVISTNSKKNVQNLVDQINANDSLTDDEKLTLVNDLYSYVDQAHLAKKKMTVNGFWARYESDKISRMLTNAGYTADELAAEIGVSEEEIMKAENWNKDIFMGKWQLSFQYTGELLKYVGR